MRYFNFQQMSVHVQNAWDIGHVSISMGDNPASWQASFISPTYYPPGTIINIVGIPFTVTTVSKQTANVWQYSAYATAVLRYMYAMGKIDNTGAYERVSGTNPYQWSRLGDLTVAIQNVVRNSSQNTISTPFERSFDRFAGLKWDTGTSLRDSLHNLYVMSQSLVIPWYVYGTDRIDWISVQDWLGRGTVHVPEKTVTQINIIGRPKGVKIFAKNKYKKAVTMYECPMLLNPDSNMIDVGFYVMACEGGDTPTVRFTHNYSIGFSLITRVKEDENVKDSSGMVNNGKYWYETMQYQPSGDSYSSESVQQMNELAQLYLKSLIFTSHPIITFDAEKDYLDSYFPYPISPWNFQVYFKPDNSGRWIPTGTPYAIYDLNLIRNLTGNVWTGAYCSVTRIPTVQRSDEVLNKDIAQQGFYVKGFNVGSTINPFSLITVESQTQMPVIAEDVVSAYARGYQMPSGVVYRAYLINGLQKQLYQYGLTLEQVTDNEDLLPTKIVEINTEHDSVTTDADFAITEFGSYGPVKVFVCYREYESRSGKKFVSLADDVNIGLIKVVPTSKRTEKYYIIVFSTAIYFITFRSFASKMYLCMPYVYKFDEVYPHTLTSDYDIITVDNYSNLLSRVKGLVDRSVVFEWEGHVDEFPELIPYRFVDIYGGRYVISNVNITLDGDYAKAVVTADNRHVLYQRWSKITSDIVPQRCSVEIYPRIPNRHFPPSRIYAYSDREHKVREYLRKVFKYTYT